MTKRVLASILCGLLGCWGLASPALADHGGGGYYEEGDRDRNRGGGECAGAEEYCSDDDFSPSFEDSPVDRSFNPVICLPGSTCHTQPEQPPNEGSQDGPQRTPR